MNGLGRIVIITVALVGLGVTVFTITRAEAEGLYAQGGEDRVVECTSSEGALVPLDASRSHPAENDSIVSYTWYEGHNTSAQRVLGLAPHLKVTLPLGAHAITLRVDNATNATAWDNFTVTIVDTTAPTLAATPSVSSLWPPNHKGVPVSVAVVVTDACTASPTFVLRSATSDENDDARGDGHTVGDLGDAEVGTADTSFVLRSERAGLGDGRVYRLEYASTDASGNTGVAVAEVSVPHG